MKSLLRCVLALAIILLICVFLLPAPADAAWVTQCRTNEFGQRVCARVWVPNYSRNWQVYNRAPQRVTVTTATGETTVLTNRWVPAPVYRLGRILR